MYILGLKTSADLQSNGVVTPVIPTPATCAVPVLGKSSPSRSLGFKVFSLYCWYLISCGVVHYIALVFFYHTL